MPKIKVTDQSTGAHNVPVNHDQRTPAQKRRDTIISQRFDGDEQAYIAAQRAQASRGGLNGGRPFRDDPGLATKAVKSRWSRHSKKVGNEAIRADCGEHCEMEEVGE